MRVLVTGSSGFVGGALVRYLVKQGLDVRTFNRPEGNILDFNSIIKACDGVDSVFHLAGVVAYTRSLRKVMDDVNIRGTQNIINACVQKKIRRLLHFSSVAAVGASIDGKTLLNENSEFNLHHLNLGYFESKYAAEQLVVRAVKLDQLDAVIVNPATIYGPEDAKKGSRSIQLKVARGKFPFYPPGGVNVISIEDVVAATYQAWQIGRTGERYVLSGENLLIKDVFQNIAKIAGVHAPKIPLPRSLLLATGKVGDYLESIGKNSSINSENAWASVLFHWFDNTKAKQELGLNPKPAMFALEESVNWMKANKLLD